MGDAESIDIDAQQMVDGLTSPSVGGQPFNAAAAVEEDEIIKTTRELLAQLKKDDGNTQVDDEEEKAGEVKKQLTRLGDMIDKAEQIR